ncbi:MAG: GAF domain-containing protein [Burkholderiaceae bacterium]|nr:GAF domain-containing protein [Burkholderiaceae bacterium]
MPSTFIQAAELWLPSSDGSLLDFDCGAFGQAKRFEVLSRSMCFGRGEGLPGRAWDEGRPILLRDLSGVGFRRSDAAQSAGYTCAVALPYFAGERISGVLVLFCSHDPAQISALELWHHNARVTSDMTLADGAYGAGAQGFEALSRETYLPRGIGLPGLAWQQGATVFIEDLASVPGRFLRSESAAEAGLQRGLAIPVGSRIDDGHVVTFLAGAGLPLARRIERWIPDDARTQLNRDFAFSELHGGRSTVAARLPIPVDDEASTSSIVNAWTRGVPVINAQPSAEQGPPAAAAATSGSDALIAIPVVWEGVVSEVVVLYL